MTSKKFSYYHDFNDHSNTFFYDCQDVSTFILTIYLSATCLNKETVHKYVITSG